ncbi:MAG: bifunctional D-glycero-beta-D-manno-heptose-7-phosphate kinase/D-glycero-beta-D-manno-heptose 1-phosphate adenylyltransferase HldE [Gammaproteobacteria bacterium]|nr:bifunctional D-glycero-beta-D-manno-heptose-7-phosphate kinase/D-glycero-beta-D-manno-heptose 1-phosphate adenylyltransferase HldE [Gammaproteobacteria bacterium]
MKPKIPDFTHAQVLVVGDLMLDRYWYGDTTRISPEAPVPVVHVGDTEERAGGAGNVALNISVLGAKATVIGLTGDDEAANSLQRCLERKGVKCCFEKLPGYATVTKLRIMSRHQQLIRMDFEDGFCGYDPKGLLARYEQQLPAADVVVLSDYGKGSLQIVEQLIALAREKEKPVVIDPKGTDFYRYRGATLLTPNLSEFEAVVGVCADDEEIEQKGEQLRRELNLQALLVTRSERGMSLIREQHKPLHIPTRAREVYDVTGAGDTVISVLAAALAAGEDMADAMVLANLAAGIVVGKLGTATASVPELQRAIREDSAANRGVVSEQQLLELVKEVKAHGETLVMTNGCFDILHKGHVQYLQQARQLGDRLIVAVNSDESVRQLKGAGRPINPLASRMVVLAALECVDWVVDFGEATPERLICSVVPHVMVKGGDYRPDEIAGGRCVQEAGGKVVVLEFVEGHSTTRTINAIRNLKTET